MKYFVAVVRFLENDVLTLARLQRGSAHRIGEIGNGFHLGTRARNAEQLQGLTIARTHQHPASSGSPRDKRRGRIIAKRIHLIGELTRNRRDAIDFQVFIRHDKLRLRKRDSGRTTPRCRNPLPAPHAAAPFTIGRAGSETHSLHDPA